MFLEQHRHLNYACLGNNKILYENKFPKTIQGKIPEYCYKVLKKYRFIDNPELAALYRNSFKHYTQEKLIISIIGYVSMVSFSIAVICIKYSISIVLAIPVFIAAIIWYFHLTLKKDSPAKEPEKLLKYKEFYIFTVLTILVFILAKILNPHLEFLLRIWG